MKEGVEATRTQPRTYLEIQLKGGEIPQNKQLNRSKRESSKHCTHGSSFNNLPKPAQQNTRGGGRSDTQLTRWREGLTKERPNNNQTPKTYKQST